MKHQLCYKCMKPNSDSAVCIYCGDNSSIPNQQHQLAAGTILNRRYFIGRSLGQGGFGITYAGMDMQTNCRIAVKEFFPTGIVMRSTSSQVRILRADDSFCFEKHKERFLREYQTLSGLSGIPQIVKVSDFFLENNTAYIVMEYIEGITLKQYVSNHGGRLSGAETFRILTPVMHSLAKIHEAGLIHRDISPDNLMILSDGSAKLLDFGAVRDIGADAGMPQAASATAVFKNGYAPLEQYQSHGNLGPWTDVYALCATACCCLTGEAPPESLERLLQDTPVLIREKGADVSACTEYVLKKGMELRIGDRIATMNQLLAELSKQKEGGPQNKSASAGTVTQNPKNADRNTVEKPEDADKYTTEDPQSPEKITAQTSKNTAEARKKNLKNLPPFSVRKKRLLAASAVCTAFFCTAVLSYYHSSQPAANKAIAAPVHFRNYSEDMPDWSDTGTDITLGCGTVSAFSKDYTLSCSLYLPKAACAADMSRIIVYCRLDLDDHEKDAHIGTTDGRYTWSLLNTQNEIFPVVTSENGTEETISESSAYSKFFDLEETGDFYRLDVKDLPFFDWLHNEDSSNTNIAIPTNRSGRIGIGIHVTGFNQSLSSVIYLDDIVIKVRGTVIKSFDCSAESLYNHFYRYEYDDGSGERIVTEQPEVSEIRLRQPAWTWWKKEGAYEWQYTKNIKFPQKT